MTDWKVKLSHVGTFNFVYFLSKHMNEFVQLKRHIRLATDKNNVNSDVSGEAQKAHTRMDWSSQTKSSLEMQFQDFVYQSHNMQFDENC